MIHSLPSQSPSLFASRLATRFLAATLALGALFVADRPSAEAYYLSNSDLRRGGFSGTYRGTAEGRVTAWDGFAERYDTRFIRQRSVERIPARRRSVVNGPTGNNGFFLTFQTPRGSANGRRVRMRGFYSGFSYNPVYDEEMVGSGVKRIVIVRRGFGAFPRYDMRVADRLVERSSFDGALFGRWQMKAFLDK